MKKYLIAVNENKENASTLSARVREYLEKNGCRAEIVGDLEYKEDLLPGDPALSGVDAVLVLGGDGTMLRAAGWMGDNRIPLLGINLGTLGFLTEVEPELLFPSLDRLMAGDYRLEARMMLAGTVKNETRHALNDIVITRAGFSRIIGLNIWVNGELLDTYEADGVIISTPTGSTGYNLSAGGPIISPKSRAIVVTPISPHALFTKSIVYDDSDSVDVEVVEKRKTQEQEAYVSFDGNAGISLSAGDHVEMCASARSVSLIRLCDTSFYKILREKMIGSRNFGSADRHSSVR